jgi:DnaK suppressor protein
MEEEIAHIRRRLEERPETPLFSSDETDRAVAGEVYEVLAAGREAMAARVLALGAAIARMDAGTYGKCEECGDTIGAGRLRAIPETPVCVECKAREEKAAASSSRRSWDSERDA